jgi:branched-subunit amino acid transport protein
MSFWTTLIVIGLFTFAIRLSFILLFGRLTVPPGLQRALRFVPPAALSAIILPALVMPAGPVDISLQNFRLLAGLLAILVAWRSRNIFLTILIGMAALLLLQAIG